MTLFGWRWGVGWNSVPWAGQSDGLSVPHLLINITLHFLVTRLLYVGTHQYQLIGACSIICWSNKQDNRGLLDRMSNERYLGINILHTSQGQGLTKNFGG